MKKKLFILSLLTLMLCFSFFGCNNLNNDYPNNPSTETESVPESPTEQEQSLTIKQLPTIRFTITEPKDSNSPLDFITKPVSDTVKLHTNSWGEHTYDSNPAPWYEKCTVKVTDENGTEVLTNVTGKAKARGNWTTTYEKKGIKIKFDNKQKMLGLQDNTEFDEWVLLACWKDFSMLRDYTAYKLFKLINPSYYASDCKLVEVYFNEQYWGVYLLCEQQEAKRVNITKAKENDGITQTGYLLEYDGYGSLSNGQYINGSLVEQDFIIMDSYKNITDVNGKIASGFNTYYTIKSKYDASKKIFIKKYMDNLWKICRMAVEEGEFYEFNSDYSDIILSSVSNVKDCISKVIDIDSLVATFIQQEIACDLDLYWSSFYMDLDLQTGKRLTFEAPWDFDSSFGNHKDRQLGNSSNQISSLFSVTNISPCNGNPWTILFAKEDWFQKAVQSKWNEINSRNVKNTLIKEINQISDNSVYIEAFKRNYDKWKNINTNVGGELCSAAANCKTQKEAASLLISFLNQRFSMLDSAFTSFKASNAP